MELTPKTKLFPLLEQYPFLVDYLAGLRPQYSGLRNPALRKAFTRLASLAKVAQLGAMPVEELISSIQQRIKAQTGEEHAVTLGDAPLTRDERREVLKGIIKDLHAGHDVAELKQRFADLIEDVGAAEIGEMEQELIKAGLPQSEITRLCDVHLDLFRDTLEDVPLPQLPAGHPVQTFLAENAALSEVAEALRARLAQLGESPAAEELSAQRSALQADLDKLMTVELHYQRKENQLFPVLEKHGISGPPQVMWEVHDQVRAHLKEAKAALLDSDSARFVSAVDESLRKLTGMIEKEQLILLPMCLDRFSEEEWLAVWRGEEHLGFALVERGTEWPGAEVGTQAPAPQLAAVRAAGSGTAGGGFADVLLNLQTGVLTPEQVNLLFNNLPVEISFTDENHIVRYFSESGERIFPRSPGVIGRHVENCHPPKSVHMVKEILAAFESGKRDTAEFWIELDGRFVHIRYFAIHDGDGRFRGTLEVVQDVTAIRKLEGERRLLEWN
jgi:hypothetical protein